MYVNQVSAMVKFARVLPTALNFSLSKILKVRSKTRPTEIKLNKINHKLVNIMHKKIGMLKKSAYT